MSSCIKPLYTSDTLKPQQTLFCVLIRNILNLRDPSLLCHLHNCLFWCFLYSWFSCFPLVSYIVSVWKTSFSESFRAGLLPTGLLSLLHLRWSFFRLSSWKTRSLCAASLPVRTCTRLNLWSAIKTSFCGCSRGFFCGVFSSLIIICLECEFGVRLQGVRFEVSWGSWTCRLPCFARFSKVSPLFLQMCFLLHCFSSLSGIPMIQILVISQSSLTLFMFSCVFSLSFMSDNFVELFASSGTPSDILVLLLNPFSNNYVSFSEIFSSDFHLLFLGASLSLLIISVFPLRKHYHGSHSDILVWTLRLLTNGSTL